MTELQTPLPLVSLGLPVRNGAAHLAEALASVLHQDYANLEILISDNASTDGTPDICRAFAERDPRIRYWRLAEPVEVIANFRRVLSEANGACFTWVAHDDLLLSTDYLTTLVSFLEHHPDVVLAGSSVSVLDYEGPGTVSPTFLDDALPDRDWRRVRREFFRYPYRDLHRRHLWMLFYGVYRTDVLRAVGVADLTIRGRPIAFGMEYPVLAAVAARGRLVAVPTCSRAYRHRERSVGQLATFATRRVDLARLTLTLKLKLLRLAIRAPLPPVERLPLVAIALRNFLSNNLGVPNDPRGTIRTLKQENRALRAVCAERLALIEQLNSTVVASRRKMSQPPAGERPERDPAPVVDALSQLGRTERTRRVLFEILRRAEVAAADPDAFREHVRWPLVSALLPPGRTHRVRLRDGSTFEVSLDSRIERALMLSRESKPDHVWEPQTTTLLRTLCLECSAVIVGGAYIGDQVIPMARAKDRERVEGTIHAFEVSADKIGQLRRNVDLSRVRSVVINRLALWDSSGSVLGVVGECALAHCEPLDEGDRTEQERVESITIDDYARGRGLDVGLIKLDLEGGEERALRGAVQLLSLAPPYAPNLVFEVHRSYVDWSAGLGATSIVAFVRACGYVVYAIRDAHANRPMAGRPVEIIPLDSVYLEGPPHGFDLLATKDPSLVKRLRLIMVPGVSPKLLAHRDPALHSPRH